MSFYYLLVFVVGVVAGAIAAVIYYRRHVAKVEAALADAVTLRDKARRELEDLKEDLKSKVGR